MDTARVRPATHADAAAFLNLFDALDTETGFMLYEPGERQATLATQTERLTAAEGSSDVHVLVLDGPDAGTIGGFCAGRRSATRRDRHVLDLVIGIRQSESGRRYGEALLKDLERWAVHNGIQRLQLSVMVSNSRAIALYRRCGFDIEGTRRRSVRTSSGFVDEHIMARLIPVPVKPHAVADTSVSK